MRKAQLDLFFEKPSILRKYGFEVEPAKAFYFSSPDCQIVINKVSRGKGFEILLRFKSDTFESKGRCYCLSDAIDVFYEYVKNYSRYKLGEL